MRCFLLVILALSKPLYATEWEMSFPIYQQGIEIADINALSDGTSITSIKAVDIEHELSGLLSPEVNAWLLSLEEKPVSVSALKDHGIVLSFDSQRLAFDLDILSNSNSVQNLSLDRSYQNVNYSQSAYWAWQNTFNFSSEYQDGTSSNIDWLGYVNIGGYDGLNMDWSLYFESEDDDSSLYRGPIELFVDRPSYPWRYSLGDLSTDSSGHLDSITVGGFSWARNYSDLQPTRQIQNSGTQPLDLKESAQVDVYVNDSQVSRYRLSPGRYNLNDLPLSTGTNTIRLEIRYQSGKRDTITYEQFFYASLLASQTDDFGIYAGFIYDYDSNNNIYYQSTPVATGFYEYGLTDDWTVGVNALNHEDGHLLGGLIYTSQPIGTIALRGTTGYLTDEDQVPYSISLDYSQQIWGSSSYGSPNLSISLETESNFTSTPWEDDTEFTGHEFSALYTAEISDSWSANVYGNYQIESGESDEHTARFKLMWKKWDFQITGAIEHVADDDYPDGDTVYSATFQWNWYSDSRNYSATVNYDTDDDTRQVELAKNSDGNVGDWSTVAYFEETNDTDQKYLQAGYTANRFSGDITAGTSSGEEYVELQLTTAVSVVDGKLGMGNQASGPVVLVEVDDTLEADVYINDNAGMEHPEAIATHSLYGLVPLYSGHSTQNVEVNVYDAPVGYGTGRGNYTIIPGSYTGHIIKIGSAYSKTVIGTLVDKAGEPIALMNGLAVMDDQKVSFFTNRKGRFVLEGVGEGTYILTVEGKSSGVTELVIPKDSETLLYLPKTTLH